jgi:hypothetical protein
MVATFIARRAKTGNIPPFSVYTGSYAVAEKPGKTPRSEAPETSKTGWFLPLLVDPVSKSALKLVNGRLVNDEGDSYDFTNGKPDLRPKHGLSQDAGHP